MAEVKAEVKAKDKGKRKHPGPRRKRPASKRHQDNLKKVDPNKTYSVSDAIAILKSCKSTKYDQTLEIAMKLGIDPKKSEQLLRGSVSLPKGTGKAVKVLVFAEGDAADAAKNAGADVIGGKELADKIEKEGWLDFDVAIAHEPAMRYVSKLGKVLGPKGKMPSPKSGTVALDVAFAVKEFKAGKVEYRTDNFGNIHAPLGKLSFPIENLVINANAFIEHIKGVKPATAKGNYMQKVALSSTMGPGLVLDIKNV